MIEEIHFWRPEKVKFVIKLLLTIFATAILIFAVYSWTLYRQKVNDEQMDSNHQPQRMPPSTSINATNADSTNTAESSLSPMSTPANPN
jgi:hypothetical protein